MLKILRSTVKSSVIYSFGNLSSRLVGFILIPLYTTHLSVTEYGIMGMLEISAQFIIALLGMGLYNALFRWYWDEKYKGQQKSILFTITVTIIGLSLLLSIPIYLYKELLANFLLNSAQFSNLIVLLFVLATIEVLNVLVATIIRIKDKPVFFSVLMLIKLLVSLSLNIYFVVYRDKSVAGVYYAQISGAFVYLLFSTIFILKEMEFSFKKSILIEMLYYSIPLLIVALTGIVLNITDRYVLKYFTNLGEVGIYNLGFKISNTIRVFVIASVNMALQPMIFKMINQPNNKRFYSKVMTYFSFVLMIFVLGVSAFGKEIIELISRNPSYNTAYQIIPIISLSMFFTMLRDTALTGINISKKTYITTRIIFITMVSNVFLSIIFIKYFGFIGAAVSITIAQFLFFVLAYHYSQKVYYIPYEIKKITLIVFVAFLLYIGTLFTNGLDIIPRVIIKSLIVISLPFILFLLGFYEPIEIERIKGFWVKWSKFGNIKDNFNSTNNKES